MSELTVLVPAEGESWAAFIRRIRATEGELLVVLSASSDHELQESEHDCRALIAALRPFRDRAKIATRNVTIARAARSAEVGIIGSVRELKRALGNHAQATEVLHAFSPSLWRQQLRSRLQAMGLLGMPRVRVWLLIAVSVGLFGFVVLRLLPSVEIVVTPREETISHTANIFLIASGATVELPERVRSLELQPIVVTEKRNIAYDQISKEFIGESASLPINIVNESDESFSLRAGSRLQNQAGMIFRIQNSLYIEAGDSVTVQAIADPEDIYAEVIGDRGNVPAGLKWEFIGLPEVERELIHGENTVAATGGVTDYRTVVQEKDLKSAELKLRDELFGIASQIVDEEILLYNREHPKEVLTRLYYDELTHVAFTGFVLPMQFIGESMTSVPIEGSIVYTAYGYDEQYILELLTDELKIHVEDGKRLLPESVDHDRLVTHVIDYEDDLSWIKLTVDLSGVQQPILDPMTPTGARFAKHVRDQVVGKSREDAQRIVRNLPEVNDAKVSLWPPWQRILPTIPYHITIRVDS